MALGQNYVYRVNFYYEINFTIRKYELLLYNTSVLKPIILFTNAMRNSKVCIEFF